MRIKLFGTGPIYDEARAICERRGHTLVEERPYELIVLANVTRILKAPEIAEAGLGVLCFHPSLLPRHRGGDAVYWTFKMGDTESGATWFWVDEGIDTGPIATKSAFSLRMTRPPAKLCRTMSPTWSAIIAVTQLRVPRSPASHRAQSAPE